MVSCDTSKSTVDEAADAATKLEHKKRKAKIDSRIFLFMVLEKNRCWNFGGGENEESSLKSLLRPRPSFQVFFFGAFSIARLPRAARPYKMTISKHKQFRFLYQQ